MHIQEVDQKAWIQEQVEARSRRHRRERSAILASLTRPSLRAVSSTRIPRPEAFKLEGSETLIRCCTFCSTRPSTTNGRSVFGMAHRGRLNVLTNVVGKSYARSSESSKVSSIPGQPPE